MTSSTFGDDVTVVIPAFNASRTIAGAVASAHQLGAGVIVVDDGSADDTAATASAAGARVITQPNGGAARARLRGLEAVQTPFVILLDSDDELATDSVASYTRLAADPALAVVGGGIHIIDALGQVKGTVLASAERFATESLLALWNSPWPPCAAIWRTSALRAARNHPVVPLHPRYAEDYELLIRASLVGGVERIERVTARYRMYGGKASRGAIQSLGTAQAIRAHYAAALGLAIDEMPKQQLRSTAAWYRLRGHMYEVGATRALTSLVSRPSDWFPIATGLAARLTRRNRG